LVVEDNPINTIIACETLRGLGLRVTALESGSEAVDWLQSNQVDLILMDCYMPGMDGYDTTRVIRQAVARTSFHPNLPIVALSASTAEEDRNLCIEAGMTDFLSKPFSPKEMLDVLKRHLKS
jgi:CheY-like chemotaxis protein